MKRKLPLLIFTFLLVLSSAVAAYSQCIEAGHQLNSSTEEEAPSIHCPDVVLSSVTQISHRSRAYSSDFDEAPVISKVGLKTIHGTAHFRERAGSKTFSRQDLYQFEEVYRL